MASTYPDYDPNNIFARIARNEIPAKIILENDTMMVIYDVAPAARVHALAIPKGPYKNFESFASNATPDEIVEFWQGVAEAARILNLPKNGFRLITNQGRFGGQEIDHFHVHILGGEPLGGLLGLPVKMPLK